MKIEICKDEAYHYFASRIAPDEPPPDSKSILEVPEEFADRYFAAKDAWDDVTHELELLISDRRQKDEG